MSRTRYPAVEAVGALIRARPDWIDTDDGPRRITHPCLLAMLEDGLLHASAAGRGGGHSAGSILIDTTAWDLLAEIRYDTHYWARELGINSGNYATPDTPRPGKPATPALGKLLRAAAVVASTTARDGIADSITTQARRWTRQIEEMLADTPREQRHLRGAECPACVTIQPYPRWRIGPRSGPQPTRWVSEDREDGLRYQVPAIVLVTPRADADDREPTLVCLACGWHGRLVDVAHVTAQLVAVSDTPNDHPVDD